MKKFSFRELGELWLDGRSSFATDRSSLIERGKGSGKGIDGIGKSL